MLTHVAGLMRTVGTDQAARRQMLTESSARDNQFRAPVVA
jgi:hypothetical protein